MDSLLLKNKELLDKQNELIFRENEIDKQIIGLKCEKEFIQKQLKNVEIELKKSSIEIQDLNIEYINKDGILIDRNSLIRIFGIYSSRYKATITDVSCTLGESDNYLIIKTSKLYKHKKTIDIFNSIKQIIINKINQYIIKSIGFKHFNFLLDLEKNGLIGKWENYIHIGFCKSGIYNKNIIYKILNSMNYHIYEVNDRNIDKFCSECVLNSDPTIADILKLYSD